MSDIVRFAAKRHAAFGALGTLEIVGQAARCFTRQEAGVVSRALDAVATGASPERQIFMSPIASDHEFEAVASDEGLRVLGAPLDDVMLSWAQARALSTLLRAFSAGA